MIAALRLTAGGTPTLITIAQEDGRRSYIDRASVVVSSDGRYVVFESYATLVQADTDEQRDIYTFDRVTGSVFLESAGTDREGASWDNLHAGLSADATLLVYETFGAAPEGVARTIVLRNRRNSTSRAVGPIARDGHPGSGSHSPVISADGRFIAFVTSLSPAGTIDVNGATEDVCVFDLRTGLTTRVSVDDAGAQAAEGFSAAPSISASGRFVAFTSSAPLHPAVAGDNVPRTTLGRPVPNVYVRDTELKLTRLVSLTPAGAVANGASWDPSIDGSGRYVVFVSTATNLASADRNRTADVFVADLRSGVIELVSRAVKGGSGNGASANPAISTDGRFVVFQSEASDLVCARGCPRATEDINLLWDVFLFDRETRTMTRVSTDAAGGWSEPSVGPAIDASGLVIAFSSRRPVSLLDTENDFDLFIRASVR